MRATQAEGDAGEDQKRKKQQLHGGMAFPNLGDDFNPKPFSEEIRG